MGKRRASRLVVLGLMLACWAVAAACAARPIKKGETVRCPSCGVEFKVEEGMKP